MTESQGWLKPPPAYRDDDRVVLIDAIEERDVEIKRLRARVADLEEQCLRALGERATHTR